MGMSVGSSMDRKIFFLYAVVLLHGIECDICHLYTGICDDKGNCCNTGELDHNGDDFELGDSQIFDRNGLGECQDFNVNFDAQLTLRVSHTGVDAWRGYMSIWNDLYKTGQVCEGHDLLDGSDTRYYKCNPA